MLHSPQAPFSLGTWTPEVSLSTRLKLYCKSNLTLLDPLVERFPGTFVYAAMPNVAYLVLYGAHHVQFCVMHMYSYLLSVSMMTSTHSLSPASRLACFSPTLRVCSNVCLCVYVRGALGTCVAHTHTLAFLQGAYPVVAFRLSK
jgi:hypothetical protein